MLLKMLSALLKAEMRLNTLLQSDLSNLVPDSYRCPFTGRVMNDPVMTDDGVNYERSELQTWIKTKGYISPVSGIAISARVVVNRTLKNMIEEVTQDNVVITPALLRDLRLRLALRWLTKSKMDIVHWKPRWFRYAKYEEYIDMWPLLTLTLATVDLAWNAFESLRLMVYQQFTFVAGESKITETIKQTSQLHFTMSMTQNINKSKTTQLIEALKDFTILYPQYQTNFEDYKRASKMLLRWCDYWGETLPNTDEFKPVPEPRWLNPTQNSDQVFDTSQPQISRHQSNGINTLPHERR